MTELDLIVRGIIVCGHLTFQHLTLYTPILQVHDKCKVIPLYYGDQDMRSGVAGDLWVD